MRLRVLLATMTVALIGIVGGGPAGATSESTRVGTSVEAWHRYVAACQSPLDCALLPVPAVYPGGTLHVGVYAGRRSSATFFELDLAAIPPDHTITGGDLRLPVDTTPGHGTLTPETATLVVCVVTGLIEPAAGSPTNVPETDCGAGTAVATYAEAPQQAFTVDLAPFAERWASGERAALAVLPAPEAEAGGASWHVAFWATGNPSPDAAPITAEIAHGASDGAKGAHTAGPVVTSDSTGVATPSTRAPVPSVGALPTSGTFTVPSVTTRATPEVAAPALAPVAAPSGFAYPAVLLAPFALVVCVLTAGRWLTATPVRQRGGA